MIKYKQNIDFKNETTNLAIGVFTDDKHPLFNQLDEAVSNELSSMLGEKLVSTKFKDITPIYSLGSIKAKKIILVGLGKREEYSVAKQRQVIGKLAKEAEEDLVLIIDTFTSRDTTSAETSTTAAEALTLATYKVDSYKTEEPNAKTITFYIYSQTDVQLAIERGVIYAEATNHARQLYNEPGNKLTATILANKVANFARHHQLEYTIIEKEEMKQRNMGGIIGVNQGSTEPPKVIVVKYQGTADFDNVTAIIGKGVTFDTGGYCLKPRTGMLGMQGDMGGAASAFGAFEAAVRLHLPVNLLLVIPTTDNMVSADAIKPGDVLHMMSGKTVEVTNTDAEGRLILADAITLAKEAGASQIIDIATLTGAIIVALGSETTGTFTNNQEFFNQFRQAAELTDEDIWQMPLFPRDQEALRKSLVADLNNSPVGKPGAIMAAAFLKEFVEDTPWIHLDIAGTSEIKTNHDLGPKGATGVMVRTITKYLENQT